MATAVVLMGVGYYDRLGRSDELIDKGSQMLKAMIKFLPPPIKEPLEIFYHRIKYLGLSKYCPVCKSWLRGFKTYRHSRRDAQCPVCKALERHRFLWWFIKKHTVFFDKSPKKMLHFAPEPFLVSKFQKISGLDYVTADLFDSNAMLKMDITKIEYPDESIDLFYCSHVLEHVQDDFKAISEIYRVLKKRGYAIIMVPITAEKTLEDPSVTDPATRKKLFGQQDHVRKYGPDLKDRLIAGGFEVSEYYFENLLSKKQIEKMGLSYLPSKTMPIYLCEKGCSSRF